MHVLSLFSVLNIQEAYVNIHTVAWQEWVRLKLCGVKGQNNFKEEEGKTQSTLSPENNKKPFILRFSWEPSSGCWSETQTLQWHRTHVKAVWMDFKRKAGLREDQWGGILRHDPIQTSYVFTMGCVLIYWKRRLSVFYSHTLTKAFSRWCQPVILTASCYTQDEECCQFFFFCTPIKRVKFQFSLWRAEDFFEGSGNHGLKWLLP